ncbi:MAG TPA: lipocalin-like domain-containing protein [Solirubrobacteraceae bacterium]|nr:lipocalin-like domain-containing protein [Solirubrobacteraceae bacterium]
MTELSLAVLVGAWRLVSIESTDEAGVVSYPFGQDPTGQLLYESNGRMSAQLVRSDRTRFGSEDNLAASDGEAVAAWRGYVGYFGTFSVDAVAGTVTHHVEGAWFPNFEGRDQLRSCRLDGNRLELGGPTPYGMTLISWERIG